NVVKVRASLAMIQHLFIPAEPGHERNSNNFPGTNWRGEPFRAGCNWIGTDYFISIQNIEHPSSCIHFDRSAGQCRVERQIFDRLYVLDLEVHDIRNANGVARL